MDNARSHREKVLKVGQIIRTEKGSVCGSERGIPSSIRNNWGFLVKVARRLCLWVGEWGWGGGGAMVLSVGGSFWYKTLGD